MIHETWTVKNRSGKKLGSIKKLIIDSKTRQIAYADLTLSDTNQVVRIPWGLLAVKNHGILLKATKEEITAALSLAHDEGSEPVTLEVTMTATGRIRQEKTGEKADALSTPPTFTPSAA
ncbi:MAG: PRC-barrel domain-containing protein [Nitrospiraceae bacterium]